VLLEEVDQALAEQEELLLFLEEETLGEQVQEMQDLVVVEQAVLGQLEMLYKEELGIFQALMAHQ
jgi:hypothetical protein